MPKCEYVDPVEYSSGKCDKDAEYITFDKFKTPRNVCKRHMEELEKQGYVIFRIQ